MKQLVYHNRDGSFATQAARKKHLKRFARELCMLGFNQMHVRSLKLKHVHALINYWQRTGHSIGTQKNALAYLRWWARKIGKDEMIPKSNNELLIGKRNLLPTKSKAQYFTRNILRKISNQYMRLSIELQQEFGLRQEESLKFRPSYADRGSHIELKGSWTKGGRKRSIPVVSDEQRDLIDRIHAIADQGSLIPKEHSLKTWKSKYQWVLTNLGLKNLHGLRHGYAQRRYRDLAGFEPVFAGGPKRTALDSEQRIIDVQARLQVSHELGHNRIEITDVYLGR
ncbi:MAG: integrase [Gammaproteobacteria bacterium]|nr:integrase [Gammaproteobacteria bacterium]MYC24400.1 integrase [Gammaproteobacteria bacterium]